jgi:2-amino-4-hydroxy-6-hydroxymethyldihydropteridine diphosphokinase
MAKTALGLGSNIGDKRAAIDEAILRLEDGGAQAVARSSYYRTEPWGFTDQDWFVNACIIVETDLSPEALLSLCLEVERTLGRTRDIRWGPRIIDIDILTYDDLQLDSPTLRLPHPAILDRAFVLVPLAEIAPDLVIDGMTVADAQASLGSAGVTKLDEVPG